MLAGAGFPLFYPVKFPDFPWFPKSFPWFFLNFHQVILVKKTYLFISPWFPWLEKVFKIFPDFPDRWEPWDVAIIPLKSFISIIRYGMPRLAKGATTLRST